MKITTSTLQVWVFSLPAFYSKQSVLCLLCNVQYAYYREKLHVKHFWELRGKINITCLIAGVFSLVVKIFDFVLWESPRHVEFTLGTPRLSRACPPLPHFTFSLVNRTSCYAAIGSRKSHFNLPWVPTQGSMVQSIEAIIISHCHVSVRF